MFRKAATDPSPTLVALFRGDTNGNPIIFERGKTTNILLDMGLSGEMDISIIITGWGEIHQWNEW